MKRKIIVLAYALCAVFAHAAKFVYNFDRTNLAEALAVIAEQHPEIHLNFIYDEIDSYSTSASIDTDNLYQALRQIIGLNPVSIINSSDRYYIEALQHGKFEFSGRVVGDDGEPVVGASVMILAPRDSTVITYGIADCDGYFRVPCDKKNVLVKLTCTGYRIGYVARPQFSMGKVIMHQLPILLSNVSVEADNMVLTSDKNTYIPSLRQKNAARDATDLLRRMAIPQLVINPGDNSVKNVFGNSVPVYINYHQAEPDELAGMKVTDVRKVEYLESPTDPRFRGERYVVNFIVQEYEYGGYTKVSESYGTLNGSFNNTDVFSRFTYKKMTYDLYAGSDNSDYHHAGADVMALYHLGNDGGQSAVSRQELFNGSDTRADTYPVTFRATYSKSVFSARNMLSFTHHSSPVERSDGELKSGLYPEKDHIYSRNTPNRNNTFYYHGDFQGLIGAQGSFDITPSFKHTHRDNKSAYESSLMVAPITNLITENAYNWQIQASGSLAFRDKHMLSLFIAGGQNINKLVYTGSTNADDSYYNSFAACDLKYRMRTGKYTFNLSAGVGFDHNLINGISTNDFFPRFGANAWISLGRKSQVSASLYFETSTPGISLKANDVVQSNEYMYLTGNPQLKNWRDLTANISYNWFHSNALSLAAFAGYERQSDRVATIYRPYDNGKALLRDFINDGSFMHCYFGISSNYRLFDNSLQLYANLTQNFYKITGMYGESYCPFRIQLQGVYYWKSFNILVAWASPARSLTENSNYIIRRRNFHTFSIGWGNGTWSVNVAAKNIFNRGWNSATWKMRSPSYSEFRQQYDPSAHPGINFSVTYILGYGKKVRRGNEIGAQSGAQSAIIR